MSKEDIKRVKNKIKKLEKHKKYDKMALPTTTRLAAIKILKEELKRLENYDKIDKRIKETQDD